MLSKLSGLNKNNLTNFWKKKKTLQNKSDEEIELELLKIDTFDTFKTFKIQRERFSLSYDIFGETILD